MQTLEQVLSKVQARIRLRHMSLSTEQSYCGWIARYYRYCLLLPADLPPEKKLEAFLTDLAVEQGVSSRTQNQALSAILFLYREVLERYLGDIDALRARQPTHERTSPSRDQVRALRANVTDPVGVPARLIVDLLYGCGLRVSEPLELRIKDVLWGENQLVVRCGKGFKDRRVPIPERCAGPLREQIAKAESVWRFDQVSKTGVSLPYQLGKKYRSAAFAWQWFWVFPARGHCRDPRTGITVRYHLLHDTIQRAVRNAATKIGLEGFITPHVLRHAYATHSREQIEALRQLRGHLSIETTAGYRHPVVETATNPLDDLLA